MDAGLPFLLRRLLGAGLCWAAAGAWAASADAAPSASPAASTAVATSPQVPLRLAPCRLSGLETEAQCGSLARPLDPERPDGARIDIHLAVIPALSRNRKTDPVLFLAGGPGQSAVALAGPISRQLSRLGNRRDIVLIDQRGTGRSAPLRCEEPSPTVSLREATDPQVMLQRLAQCIARLKALPHGDLRQYTTHIAVQDFEAVRQALGAPRWNLVGASYGTRAALEYARQYPQAVRRMVIDGVAPPDMALPRAFALDNEAALEAVLQACEGEAACARRHPRLRAALAGLLAGLPRSVSLRHPLTDEPEIVLMQRELALSLIRQALYVPALASALPLAIERAAQGRFEALVGLGQQLASGRRGQGLAEGMHLAVVCAEDLPRLQGPAQSAEPGGIFGDAFEQHYRRACASVPAGRVPADFYSLPKARAPVLVLSGGSDPATPPRHGARVAQALGEWARHWVVAQAGHGVMGIGCMRDVLFRFIDEDDAAKALQVDAGCAARIPRPPSFALAAETPASGSRP